MRRFPEADFNDRHALLAGDIGDQLGDVFRRRIHVQQIHRLALLFQDRHDRVVAVQNHAVVEMIVDPAVDAALDLVEIDDHPLPVEALGLDGDDRPAVVAVQMPALALVMQEPMAVTEVDFSGNAEHVRKDEG